MSNWTQPVCTNCWLEENTTPDPLHEGSVLIKVPIRVKPGDRDWIDCLERCCKCGNMTASGIFIRVDPTTVPHPSKEDDG